MYTHVYVFISLSIPLSLSLSLFVLCIFVFWDLALSLSLSLSRSVYRSLSLSLTRAPLGLRGEPHWEGPPAEHPSAGVPIREDHGTYPEARGPVASVATGPACSARTGDQGNPVPGVEAPVPGGPREQGGLEGDHTMDGRPQGIRAYLGLKVGGPQPHGQQGPAVKAGSTGGPAKAKTKKAPSGLASRRARKSASSQAPSGDPSGHIQHWLTRGATGHLTTPGDTRGPPRQPQDVSPEPCISGSGCGPEVSPTSRRIPGVPGSSTDPPPWWPTPGCRRSFVPRPRGPEYQPWEPAGGPAGQPG